MRKFLVYLSLEYKKSFKVLLKSVVSIILVLVIIGAGIFGIGQMMLKSQIFQTIRVAVVVPEEASELQMITQFLSAMDSVKAICKFEYMEEDEAIEKLHEGELQALISLPETLYEDIYSGDSAEVTVYFPEETSLNIEVFRELLNNGVEMMQSAEAGVFASKDTAKIFKAKMKQSKIANMIAYTYIECAFDRNEIFNNTVFSPFGEMDLYQYYMAAGMSILILMWGMNFSFLYQKRSRIIEQKLDIMGLGPVKISLVKVIVMSSILWILGMSCYSALCIVSEAAGLSVIWFEWSALVWLFVVASAVAVYFHMFYSFFGKGMQGSVFILAINILMILCSGAVIPLVYLPDIVAKAGAYMPLNFMNRFCAEMMFGILEVSEIAGMFIWIIVVFGIGVFLAWKNTSHGINFSLKHG